MKIRPVGAELFRADGRTDMKKLIITFRTFGNAPKNALLPSQGRHFPHHTINRLMLYW